MIDSALQKRTDQVTEIGSTLIPFGTAAYASFSCSPGSPTASQSVTCQSTRFAGLPQDAPRAVPRTSPITLLYSVDRKFGCAGEHSFRARVGSAGRTCTFTASTGAAANTEYQSQLGHALRESLMNLPCDDSHVVSRSASLNDVRRLRRFEADGIGRPWRTRRR